MSAAQPPLGRGLKWAYGLGAVAYGARDTGLNSFLLLYYNQALGLPAALTGLALMLTLVADAVFDPLIGAVSDGWRSRWGRRHPFLYAAAIPAALAFAALWIPPTGLGNIGLFAWLLGAAIAARLTTSLFDAPYTAMVAELTSDYDERTSIMTFLHAVGWLSGLVLAVLAYGVFLNGGTAGAVAVSGFRGWGLTASLVMLVAMLGAAIATHPLIPRLAAHAPRSLDPRRVWADFRAIASNPSVGALLISATLLAASQGFGGSIYNYVQFYFWGLTPAQVSLIALAPFASAVLVFIWGGPLARGRDKRNLAIGLALVAVLGQPLPVALRLLGIFPGNDSAWLTPILVFHSAFETLVWMMFSALTASMVADLVEDHQRNTAGRSEGALFAMRTLVQKAVSGIGVFITGLVLARVAFPQDAAAASVPASTLTHLGLAYVVISAGLGVASALTMLGYRVTRRSHAETVSALAAPAAAE